MGNFILFLIFGFGIAFFYVRHNRYFEALDDLVRQFIRRKIWRLRCQKLVIYQRIFKTKLV